MSVAEVAIAPAARRDVRAVRVLTSAVVVGGAILLLRSGPDLRAILGPVFVTAAVSLFYVQVLVARDGKLPVFEAATFFVGATAVYTIIPLLQFIAGGMMIGPWGDPRMYDLAVTPQEFGGFAWRHVTLLCSFVFPYLLVRGKRLYPLREVYRPGREMFGAVAFWSVFLTLIFASIEWYVGPTVSLYVGGTGAEYRQLPLIMRQ
ncbi:MAG TPA: hypothetical protein VHL59_10495, partial [Thermoanaerobaculia bacterium]|nr:hypothetical protein [Thermoanaerobaculia bacterium]